jgi:hypothetical protein
MMVGTDETIQIDPAPANDTLFQSSDPGVFNVAIVPGQTFGSTSAVQVHAVGPGTAELRMATSRGDVLDSVDLTVEVPARVAIATVGTSGDPVDVTTQTVTVGNHVDLDAFAFRADGTPIQASSGWVFASDQPTIATVRAACPGGGCIFPPNALAITGVAPGSAHASASGSGVVGTIAVSVNQ